MTEKQWTDKDRQWLEKEGFLLDTYGFYVKIYRFDSFFGDFKFIVCDSNGSKHCEVEHDERIHWGIFCQSAQEGVMLLIYNIQINASKVLNGLAAEYERMKKNAPPPVGGDWRNDCREWLSKQNGSNGNEK